LPTYLPIGQRVSGSGQRRRQHLQGYAVSIPYLAQKCMKGTVCAWWNG
jgi:hypothetical protein